MSEFYRCSICGNPMFAGYLCPKCSANGLKSCEVKTTNWQEQKTIAELQKRIDELEGLVDKLIEAGDELADDREYQDDLVDLWHDVTRGLKEREE